jgi:dTDP-glucose pyrophosphorylase
MKLITNLDQYICASNTDILTAMKRIEELGNKGEKIGKANMFLLVCDKDKKLLGTLTDGDIRRGIINGMDLTSKVKHCMEKKSVVGRMGNKDYNIGLLKKIILTSTFLPIVDKENRVTNILINTIINGNLNALIMAGGYGRRLGSLTKNIPKPLIKIAGYPIIENVISNIENSQNISKIYISTYYLSDKIEEYVKERKNEINIDIIKEKNPLGTAGSIQLIENKEKKHLLVVNADIKTNLNFSSLIQFHYKRKFDATIAVSKYEVKVPYGVIDYNKDGNFNKIKEKPSLINYIAAGIYILSPDFQILTKNKGKVDMPELLSLGKTAGFRIGLFPLYEQWTDLGSPENLDEEGYK